MKSLATAVSLLAEIGRVPDADGVYDSSLIMKHFSRLGIQAEFCHSHKCLIAEYLTKEMQVPVYQQISVGSTVIALEFKPTGATFESVKTPPVLAEVINLFDRGLAPICLYNEFSLEQMMRVNCTQS